MRFALAILLIESAGVHAEPKDIAELFPADTLLYIEVNQPAVVGKDLAAYLKGTVFEVSAPDFRILRQTKEPFNGFNTSESGLLAALLAPEMLKEAARFKGVAAGIVGYGKNGESEFLLIVQPGDSTMPGNLLRAYTTARVDIRKVSVVDGIDLMQRNIVQYEDDPLLLPGVAAPPMQKMVPVGPVFVNHAGLIIIGSNREHVAAVIRRFKRKESSAALAASPALKSLQDERTKPGILCVADTRRLIQHDLSAKPATQTESPFWHAFRSLLPAASVGPLIARLEIKDDSIRLKARLQLDSKSASPFADLLDGGEIASDELKALSMTSPFMFSVALPQGERRIPRLLGCIDAIVRSTGTLGPNASELLLELEEKKLLTREVLAKVNRITLSVPSMSHWPKNQTPVPSILLHTQDGAALEKLEGAVPSILELLGGAKADAVTETVNGVRVRTLEAKASPFGHPVHYARNGSTFALGTNHNEIARLLHPANAIASFDNIDLNRPAAICVWNWVETTRGPVPAKKVDNSPRRGETPIRVSPYASYSPYAPAPGTFRLPPETLDRFDGMPPLVIALSRRGNELHLEAVQADPKRVRVKGINHLFEWFVQASTNGRFGSGYINDGTGSSIDILPLIPPPPLPPNP